MALKRGQVEKNTKKETEKIGSEIDAEMEEKGIKMYNPEGEMVPVTMETLERLATSKSRVMEIVVHGERNLNKGDFKFEKFGQTTKVNFEWFWDVIPAEQLNDEDSAKQIQKAFANGARTAIGLAYRDVYTSMLYSVAHRARQLQLGELSAFKVEMGQVRHPLTFDPFNVVEKDS